LVCCVASAATASTGVVAIRSAANSVLGEIVVSASGRTLYHTSAERRGVVACTGACAVTWPPLIVPTASKPRAGSGVKSALLGTIRRPDGHLQVTYAGLPLYLYSGDAKPGQVNGQGVGGIWHALTPRGSIVTKLREISTVSKAATTTTGSSSTSGNSTTAPGGSSGMSSGSGSGTVTGSSANAGMWCAANPSSCVNGVPVTGTTTSG
jgi:predicted lipoprotein with Yx(FWY)xxD motif